MKTRIVNDKKSEKEFIQLPKRLYKNDPYPKKNVHFQQGNAFRWLLLDENEKVIGRIAAFYEKDKAEADYVKSGGCGFFECIDNQEAANTLFDTAAEWLKSEGYEAMTGPINFGENESNWGCLIHGFEHQGFGMAYNFP
jgi:hypothetical protein